ncbi:MAG: hypothetical protein NC120_12315 [Ruminococcus sp.]|nr:hypothetical protein [Ruminococcus sp.]
MEIGDYKGNSHKSREEAAVTVRPKRKITKGKIVHKSGLQKIVDEVISDNMDNVKDYVIHDVIIPAVKSAIVDSVELLVNGQVRGRSAGKSSYISYDSKSSKSSSYISRYETERRLGCRASDAYRFDNIIVETRGDAEDILLTMEEIISEYGMVSVADLYDLAGISGSYTDNKYGWRDIRGAYVTRVQGGYTFKFPKVTALN